MKRFFYLILISILTQGISVAQTVKVLSVKTLPVSGQFPVLNATGDKILFTAAGYAGLSLFDIPANTSIKISDEDGAGYEPQFSPDNQNIYFRKTSYVNNRRLNSIIGFNIADNSQIELLEPQRFLNRIQPLKTGVMAFAGSHLLRATTSRNITADVYVTADDQLRIVFFDGKTIRYINPLKMDEPRYIWVSLSPDKRKILFTALGKGTFICDFSGKILTRLGSLNAPVWVSNNLVAGMEDKDDGHQIIASSIIIKDITTGKSTVISKPGQIAMYPTAAIKSDLIAWQTINNEIVTAQIGIQ